MLNFMHRLKRDKEEGDGGSGGGSKETPTGKEEPKGEGDNFDDNGYEIPKEEGKGDEKAKDEKSSTGYGEGDDKKEEKKEESKSDDEEIKDPKSGYGEDEPKAPKKEEPKEEPKGDDKSDKDFKLDTEGLNEDEITKLNEFVKTHSINEKQAQALADDKKADVKAYDLLVADDKAEIERKAQETKVAWHRELKEDPDFGGEKFAHSIKQAEKVIEEHLPNLKKVLTERATMLPPYVMKDLAKLAGTLYSTKKLEQGDPLNNAKIENDEDDALAFYNS